MKYTNKDLVKIAKRDNNTIRPYLLVDPLQGKHIPVSPNKSLRLFHDLSYLLYRNYSGERLLIIGFAETATAIGAAIALNSPLNTCYIHTTREAVADADYLYFTESHSHATEQRLIRNNLEELILNADRIIFAEDEVTTGNTILNIITILKKEYQDLNLKFGIVSILNGMPDHKQKEFMEAGILCTYIAKLEALDFEEKLNRYTYPNNLIHNPAPITDVNFTLHTIAGKSNPRIGITCGLYRTQCKELVNEIFNKLSTNSLQGQKVLVLGTEEFMYPALYFASQLEKINICPTVRFHATTRSPILPSLGAEYPLTSRYQLVSFYDKNRTTFIYNLEKYDRVIIIHDSEEDSSLGMKSLCTALISNQCHTINIFKWSV